MSFRGILHFRTILFFGILAFGFNSLLCYIILTTKCDCIGGYKWLLFLYTFSAAFYGLCQMATTGDFFMVNCAYMFYDANGILPVWAGEVVLFLLVTVYILNMIILTLSFIYRYLAVCRYEGLAVFQRHWKTLALLSVVIITSEMAVLIFALTPSSVTDDIFEGAFYNSTGHHVAEVAYLATVYSTKGKLKRETLASSAAFFLFAVISGLIMTVLAVKIAKELKERKKDSITVAQNHKKILILLIIQLCLPLFFNLIPLQIIVVSVYFNIRSEGLAQYFGCILTLAQTVDPLLTFYFIRPYRVALVRKLHAKLNIIQPKKAITSLR